MKQSKPLKTPKLPKQTPGASSHPYMVLKPYGKDTYCRSFTDAKNKLYDDLAQIKRPYKDLKAQDSLDLISKLTGDVGRIPIAGGTVEGLIDPTMNLKYSAEIIRRKDINS